MADLVIVTKHCYLVCERINFITIADREGGYEEEKSFLSNISRRGSRKSKKKKKPEAEKKYRIVIDFIPVNMNSSGNQYGSSSNQQSTAVAIDIKGEDEVLTLFKQIVEQIREQMPDKLWLDKLVEKFFAENPDK